MLLPRNDTDATSLKRILFSSRGLAGLSIMALRNIIVSFNKYDVPGAWGDDAFMTVIKVLVAVFFYLLPENKWWFDAFIRFVLYVRVFILLPMFPFSFHVILFQLISTPIGVFFIIHNFHMIELWILQGGTTFAFMVFAPDSHKLPYANYAPMVYLASVLVPWYLNDILSDMRVLANAHHAHKKNLTSNQQEYVKQYWKSLSNEECIMLERYFVDSHLIDLGNAIEQGNYCSVYCAKVRSSVFPRVHLDVAVKIINIEHLKRELLEMINKEVQIMGTVHHRNVIRYIGCTFYPT